MATIRLLLAMPLVWLSGQAHAVGVSAVETSQRADQFCEIDNWVDAPKRSRCRPFVVDIALPEAQASGVTGSAEFSISAHADLNLALEFLWVRVEHVDMGFYSDGVRDGTRLSAFELVGAQGGTLQTWLETYYREALYDEDDNVKSNDGFHTYENDWGTDCGTEYGRSTCQWNQEGSPFYETVEENPADLIYSEVDDLNLRAPSKATGTISADDFAKIAEDGVMTVHVLPVKGVSTWFNPADTPWKNEYMDLSIAYSTPMPVPLPAGVWLGLSGVVALGIAGRRRPNAAS